MGYNDGYQGRQYAILLQQARSESQDNGQQEVKNNGQEEAKIDDWQPRVDGNGDWFDPDSDQSVNENGNLPDLICYVFFGILLLVLCKFFC